MFKLLFCFVLFVFGQKALYCVNECGKSVKM